MRPEGPVAAHHFEALGTSCSLFGAGLSPSDLLRGEFWIRRLGARMTRFSPDSELSLLNSGAGRWVPVSQEMEDLLHASLRGFGMSGGLVNVAVLPSMLAIGYTRPLVHGPTGPAAGGARPLPALTEVLEVRSLEARVAPGCGIDLGGIAKGWMADRLSDRLGPNVLINLGGDLSARGNGPEGAGWPVGIGGATVLLQDRGAATSSIRRRRWGGLHHLIDPRTGRPSEGGLAEVSVVADTAVDAEIIAKTALLVGPDLAPAFCAAHADAWWLLS
jgi:thiamine biosynthesis lipoprotein